MHGQLGEVDVLAESELGVSSAVQADVGTPFGRWVTEQLGRTWPTDASTPEGGARGILDTLLTPPFAPGIRTRVRPIERAVERPVSIVAATAIRDVLASWRAAERELAVTAEDSPAWPHVNARLISLRVAYHRLFDEANAPG
jgi:hypothetical protein